MHKNNTETVWCQSTADVDTLEWFLTKLPSWKAFSLKLVDRLVFMFTFTMSPENGKCKFKDELLTMAAYKEWVCQDPKGDICSARCQFCTKSIYIVNGGRYSLDCHVKSITHKNNTETDWCHKERRCRHVGGVMMKLPSWKAFFVEFSWSIGIYVYCSRCLRRKESVNLKMNCWQWWHTKNGYVKIRRETFVLHDVKFAQTPSTPGGCYSLDSHVKSVMHKNNTETVWCQSTAYVDLH